MSRTEQEAIDGKQGNSLTPAEKSMSNAGTLSPAGSLPISTFHNNQLPILKSALTDTGNTNYVH